MNSVVFGILTVCFVSECVSGVKVQFFQTGYYQIDLHYENNSTAKCNNVPEDKKDRFINSIKTDTCLMVYFNPDCNGGSRKFDLDNPLGWDTFVRSFHICNEDIGGPQLKIDITKPYDWNKPTVVPDVLESYRNVCSCINVPQYVQNMNEWSINNYGNDFLAYYHPNCSENKEGEIEAKSVPAGISCRGSGCIQEYKLVDNETQILHQIQSIGPNPNSKYFKTSCSQFPVNNRTVDFVQVENETKVMSMEDQPNYEQKQDQHFPSLDANNDQLEKEMDTLLTEKPDLKNTGVELELNQSNLCRSLENSIQKLKDEFSNFIMKIDDKLNKLNAKLNKIDEKLSKFVID